MHGFFLLRAAEMLSGEFHHTTSLTLLTIRRSKEMLEKARFNLKAILRS
jgi:hypothetical protein